MRAWHELVAAVGDPLPGGVPMLGLILLVATAAAALLWYWWPEWWSGLARVARGVAAATRGVARRTVRGIRALRRLRWPGFAALRMRWRLRWSRRRVRWRWRRRRRPEDEGEQRVELPPDELPELPAATLVLSADELAAQGRYREAVRERLRAIVRELVDRGVVDYRPGWTVTELAGMAGQARPATAAPLAAASEIFSSIWYGQRQAQATHDAAMREYAAEVHAALDDQRVGV